MASILDTHEMITSCYIHVFWDVGEIQNFGMLFQYVSILWYLPHFATLQYSVLDTFLVAFVIIYIHNYVFNN